MLFDYHYKVCCLAFPRLGIVCWLVNTFIGPAVVRGQFLGMQETGGRPSREKAV